MDITCKGDLVTIFQCASSSLSTSTRDLPPSTDTLLLRLSCVNVWTSYPLYRILTLFLHAGPDLQRLFVSARCVTFMIASKVLMT